MGKFSPSCPVVLCQAIALILATYLDINVVIVALVDVVLHSVAIRCFLYCPAVAVLLEEPIIRQLNTIARIRAPRGRSCNSCAGSSHVLILLDYVVPSSFHHKDRGGFPRHVFVS